MIMMSDDDEWWWAMMMSDTNYERWWWAMMMMSDDVDERCWWWAMMMSDEDERRWWAMMMSDDDERWWWAMMSMTRPGHKQHLQNITWTYMKTWYEHRGRRTQQSTRELANIASNDADQKRYDSSRHKEQQKIRQWATPSQRTARKKGRLHLFTENSRSSYIWPQQKKLSECAAHMSDTVDELLLLISASDDSDSDAAMLQKVAVILRLTVRILLFYIACVMI